MATAKAKTDEAVLPATDTYMVLHKVDVSDHVEEKDAGKTKLKYLSWAWAWHEVRKRFPDASYNIVKNENGLPYFVDPVMGIMVYTEVTIAGETHMMWLPVMDGANNPMRLEPYEYQVKNPAFRWAKWNEAKQGYFDNYGNRQEEYLTKKVAAATMFDVNKTVMRCLTKNLAMFGIGLALYAGEDLFDDPEGNRGDEAVPAAKQEQPKAKAPAKEEVKAPAVEETPVEENASETTDDMLPLAEVIKELDIKIGAMRTTLTEERKKAFGEWMKSKLGMMNYRNCTDVVALNNVLKELSAA